MQLEDFLMCFPDLLVIIQDDKNNILYPTDSGLLDYIMTFIRVSDNEYFHPIDRHYYSYQYIERGTSNGLFKITRFTDITENKKYIEQYEIDETTGVLCKKKMISDLEEYIRNLSNISEDYTLVMCDIDYFKATNDTYGHLAGDKVLYCVAQTILSNIRHNKSIYKGIIRPEDILGRFGGEEFLILLKNINEADSIVKLEYLRKVIENLDILYEDNVINVTMSFGAVHIPNEEIRILGSTKNKTSTTLSIANENIIIADNNLYEAKAKGRNQVVLSRYNRNNNYVK